MPRVMHHGAEDITGEYRITAITENSTTKFKVEVERISGSKEDTNTITGKVSQKIKTRMEVKSKEVVVLDEGSLPRATHKAKRLVDLRAAIKPAY